MTIFDIINSIHYTKIYLGNDPEFKSVYNKYAINTALSYFPENIVFVNFINAHNNIPIKMQYDYYFYNVIKRKRYIDWDKSDKKNIININAIKEYYNFSTKKAITALSILDDSQIEYIKEKLNKGGTNYG